MRNLKITLVLMLMMSLCSCMVGPILAVEAVDDMIVDVVPGDKEPQFWFPVIGDLHEVNWRWELFLPWTWFGIGVNGQ